MDKNLRKKIEQELKDNVQKMLSVHHSAAAIGIADHIGDAVHRITKKFTKQVNRIAKDAVKSQKSIKVKKTAPKKKSNKPAAPAKKAARKKVAPRKKR